MERKQIWGLSGILFLLAGQIIPIAKLDEGLVSVLPVWNNFNLYNGMYEWRDISFFAVSLFLLAAVSAWLLLKKKFRGLIFTGSLSLFAAFIIFIAIFFIQANLLASATVMFTISWGSLFLVLGAVMLIVSGGIRT